MKTYRSKVYKVNAEQFLPDEEPPQIPSELFMDRGGEWQLPTPVGNYAIQPGEWVLVYPDGKRWRCPDDYFQRDYEMSSWGNHLKISGLPAGRFDLTLNGMQVIVDGVELVMGVGQIPRARLILDLEGLEVDAEMMAYLTAKFGFTQKEEEDGLET